MHSRDIHSRDGGKKVRDLLVSFLGTLLLSATTHRTIYLISPWLSDFKLLDNNFGQFKNLFRNPANFGESPYILFSEVLIEASDRVPIRIITWPDDKSKIFANRFKNVKNVKVKFEKAQKDHQKGLLSDLFYFEGSMNFTFSGVYLNKEKITCNAAYDLEGGLKINEAYLEFERIWDNLA
ncbi:MAG: phospholipase D-like domain-containing protein DpdK [Desulfobacteraceae bacterium]|jgi:hypothetical protein|nr:phospholipase D-like domain-containing protein DpdK [Desulfobacteraceae bacterium]